MNRRAYSARYTAFLKALEELPRNGRDRFLPRREPHRGTPALQDVRPESGLTQVDLAARLGETQSFVSKCERGTRRIAELQAFCHSIDIPLSRLIARL